MSVIVNPGCAACCRFRCRVQGLAELADLLLLRVRAGGEGEGIEARTVLIPGTIFQQPAGMQSPGHMNCTGKHAEDVRVVCSNRVKRRVGNGAPIRKCKRAVLSYFRGDDLPAQPLGGASKMLV